MSRQSTSPCEKGNEKSPNHFNNFLSLVLDAQRERKCWKVVKVIALLALK